MTFNQLASLIIDSKIDFASHTEAKSIALCYKELRLANRNVDIKLLAKVIFHLRMHLNAQENA